MGWTNADNKFGPCSFVVGPTVGDGCNYTSIQSAINDVFAIGTGNVLIRPSTYGENLTLKSGVNLIGVSVDGDAGDVRITGSHVLVDGSVSCSNIHFNSPADAFTVGNPVGAGSAQLELVDCLVVANLGKAFELNSQVGIAGITLTRCNVSSSNYTINCTSLPYMVITDSDIFSSGAGAIFVVSGSGAGSATIYQSRIVGIASPAMDIQDAGFTTVANYTYFEGANQPISFNAAASFSGKQNSFKNSAATTEYIVGPGVYTYGGDVIDPIQSSGIDGATTQIKLGARPWAETGTGVATDVRGSANFDSTQFTVTDGFVQFLSGTGLLTWFDRAVSVAVPAFTGNAVTATSVTLTLPTAPANGAECDFLALGANVITVQAGGTDIIRLGSSTSSAGGTITSTALGDSVRLVYMTLSTTWCAIGGTQGNWTLA